MPGHTLHMNCPKHLLVRYDSYIEIVEADAGSAKDFFNQVHVPDRRILQVSCLAALLDSVKRWRTQYFGCLYRRVSRSRSWPVALKLRGPDVLTAARYASFWSRSPALA
jgi:hypothetical protein